MEYANCKDDKITSNFKKLQETGSGNGPAVFTDRHISWGFLFFEHECLMANPQWENGYTKIANEIMEALSRTYLPSNHWRCLMVILRHIYGFSGKKYVRISISELSKRTGVSRSKIPSAIASMENHRIIKVGTPTGTTVNTVSTPTGTNRAKVYEFNKNYEDWIKYKGGTPTGTNFGTPTGTNKADPTIVLKQKTSIGKKTPPQKTKKQKKFLPPSESDVISYFSEKGYTTVSAKKAFEYYDVAGWKDSRGNQVKNWKQKMIAVWFKDENKRPECDNLPEQEPLESLLN